MNSPYFFSSIDDEYARRQEHTEIVKENGERVILVGKFQQKELTLQPTEAERGIGKTWHQPAPVRQAPEGELTFIDWLIAAGLVAVITALCVGYL